MTRQERVELDHFDVRRLVMPIWAAATILISMVMTTGAVLSLYFSLIGKIDEMQRNVSSLLESVAKATSTAEAALTAKDLDNWCLKAQIVNNNWRCPLVTSDGTVALPPTPASRQPPYRPRQRINAGAN